MDYSSEASSVTTDDSASTEEAQETKPLLRAVAERLCVQIFLVVLLFTIFNWDNPSFARHFVQLLFAVAYFSIGALSVASQVHALTPTSCCN